MNKGKQSGRKGGKIARMPATKFPKLQKQMRQARIPITLKIKKLESRRDGSQ